MELELAPAERRGLGAAKQTVPHHLHKGQVHRGAFRGLGFGLLASVFPFVDPLDPCRGLDRGKALVGQAISLLRGFPCSLPSRFMVAFTSGRAVGSVCPRSRWAVAIAARRRRGGHRPAFHLHQVLDVTPDVGRWRRQAGTPDSQNTRW